VRDGGAQVTAENNPIATAAPLPDPSERLIIFLVAAVQFVNILDFMMVMPLGPDFAKGLGIPTSHLGLIGGSYALAAATAGLLGAPLLDRFDRRKALAIAMLGLVAGTAAGAAAHGLGSMIAARVVAGMFGGPATSLSLSIIADVVPPARRGRAMGTVMGAFSVASVLGVPAGLNLARHGGWRFPFLAVAGLGLVIAGLALRGMPPLRGHLANRPAGRAFDRMRALLADPTVRLALLANGLVMTSSFLVVPNIAAHLQQNLGYPRPRLELAYMVGGAFSFVVLAVAGRTVDRRGPAFVSTVGTVVLAVALLLGFIAPNRIVHLPVLGLFIIFMSAMSMRNVSLNSLSTRVPRNHERAAFMSLQSTAQHLSSAFGSFVAARLLHSNPNGRLDGVSRISTLSLALACTLPPMLLFIGRRVRAREAT
jgi:predicted MFS family arabinose efflux permease